jgi:hypothetical protein
VEAVDTYDKGGGYGFGKGGRFGYGKGGGNVNNDNKDDGGMYQERTMKVHSMHLLCQLFW